MEDYNNTVEIVTVRRAGWQPSQPLSRAPLVQLDEEAETATFRADPRFTFLHPYPPTKLMFIPDKVSGCAGAGRGLWVRSLCC